MGAWLFLILLRNTQKRIENVEVVRMTFIFKLNLVKDESQITGKSFILKLEINGIKIQNIYKKNVDDL